MATCIFYTTSLHSMVKNYRNDHGQRALVTRVGSDRTPPATRVESSPLSRVP